MNEPQLESPELSESAAPRWQFRLSWLFVLMTAVAAIATLVRYAALDPRVRIVLAIYLTALGAYAVLRVPTLLANGRQMRRIRDHREKLDQWAKWKRETKRADEASK